MGSDRLGHRPGHYDRNSCAGAARAPGALAAMFAMYAAIAADDAPRTAVELAAHGKLTLPVLGLGGAASVGDGMAMLLADVAEAPTTLTVPDCGHYVMEERPAAVTAAVRSFVAERSPASP